MARDEAAREAETETSTVNRRSYLKAAGLAAFTTAVAGTTNGAAKPPKSSSTDTEIRDLESNLNKYKPESKAKFFAIDTGRIFIGDGSQWNGIASTGPTPSLESVTANDASIDEFEQADSYIVYNRDGQTCVLNAQTQAEEYTGDAASALQHAIDNLPASSGGTVQVKPGTYVCEQSVTLDGSKQLVGAGNNTQLQAADGLDAPLLTIPSEAAHARVSSLKLHGNKDNNTAGSCIRVEPSWRVVFDHIVIRHGAEHGIHFPSSADDSYEPIIIDADVARCGGDGYRLSSAIDFFGVDVYAEANAGHGVVIDSPGQVHVHTHAYASGAEAGILVTGDAGDTRFLAPWAENNDQHGMVIQADRTTVLNPYIYNNGRNSAGQYDGIVLDANGCTVTTGVFNDFGEAVQRHHINERDESYNNIITHNQLLNCVESPVRRFPYSGSIIRDNQGYTTENGGHTTVADGATIAHGLDESPVVYSVETAEPGVIASVQQVDADEITVELLNVADGTRVTDSVDVSWTVKGLSAS